MTRSAETIQSLGLHSTAAIPAPSAEPMPARKLGLSYLDERAAATYAIGDINRLIEEVRERAESLASSDGDACRRRVIARCLAIALAQQQCLEAALGQAFGRRDFEAARAIDYLLKSAVARVRQFVDEHRAEGGQRRNVVLIGNVEHVSVGGSR